MVDRSLQQRETTRKMLQSKKQFNVRDLVCLRLQPYRQHSIKKKWNQKLSSKYFGPFPIEARVHPTFHVSLLKKHARTTPTQDSLPIVDSNGAWAKEPARILDQRVYNGLILFRRILPRNLLSNCEANILSLILEDKDLDRERVVVTS
ncbi:polyprotein [Gossypium australe]|uniref:Polyprotein n=1 Tax=Gossypium australe TaxID=47621 RepID=A0A5B6VDA8_9ROSI|nr:polyprotein [Gossypium australe]